MRSTEEMRRQIADLIAEAVPEVDEGRRTALLVMADHWSALIRRRHEAAQPRPAA
ncbi:hypothetical protein [Brevundimonas sp.]|jgi:hypothetical protein|uniref:hypothetical protein n=1 Tax=Brevundimonas sp. TaxID=1871086 RepID=UPI0037BF451F